MARAIAGRHPGLDHGLRLGRAVTACAPHALGAGLSPTGERSDAALTSQFEQHIRAVAGWPLGDSERLADAVMTNLVGDEVDRWPELLAEPGVRVHLYGKAETRPGRKMGHATRIIPATKL